MLICGIAGYRNDSKFSLARHLRDAYGAALMVNNDRILKLNATMLTGPQRRVKRDVHRRRPDHRRLPRLPATNWSRPAC